MLRRGDTGHIEFGAVSHQYCATLGRQFVLGEPSERMQFIFDDVRAACDACVAEIAPGVSAVEPHRAAKKVIKEAGLDEFRLHLTGYGIAPGFPPSWGESLLLFEGCDDVLAPGMVVSVEPPVFISEEKLGVRLVDDVVITADSCELLSTFSRDLICID